VITLGAGSIGAVGDRILDELRGGAGGVGASDVSRQNQVKKREGDGGWA